MAATFILPGKNRDAVDFQRDKDGVWSTYQHKDEIRTYTFDYADLLAEYGSSVTISSSAWESSRVTTSGAASTTTTTTITVTGSGGWARNTLTLSSGDKIVETYRIKAKFSEEEPAY